jgi:hypothetical protein
MGHFDFIADERLRESFEKDHAEVVTANQGEAWKTVHVLVGSIVEALLVDYLLGIDFQKKSGTDPLKMDLSALITTCEKEGALSTKAVQLCSAIRGYRNLIHPGRVVRLSEVVDKNGATVATAVMRMVIDEISAKRKQEHGYTAEQIVSKLERDKSAVGILGHLLKEMTESERVRLLVKVLPYRYFELEMNLEDEFSAGPVDAEKFAVLSRCFRTASGMISEEGRKKVAKAFVEVLRKEDEHTVFTYETAFFQAGDLQYLSGTDRVLAKQHFLSRFAETLTIPLLKASEGLASFLAKDEISPLVDKLVRAVVHGKPHDLAMEARKFITNLWMTLPGGQGGLDALVVSRLDDWIAHLQKEGQSDKADIINEIKGECGDIPF